MRISILLISGLLLLSACSSTRWIVENQEEIDRKDFELLDSQLFLQRVNGINPDNPVLRFRLQSANTYEYAQRIKTDRYIQSYRPRLGYTLFGLTTAGIASYTALSGGLIDDPTTGQKAALFGSAALLTGVSFLNMKPVGEPTPTGESRLLRKTGSVVEVDTLGGVFNSSIYPVYSISYENRELVEPTPRPFINNELVFNLVEELNPEFFPEDPNAEFTFNMFFEDSSYTYQIPVSSVFEQFIVVSSDLTALRSQPVENSANVLTDLAQGSQLQLISREGDWYKVLYGISENWIAAEDIYTIWRPSQFAEELSVITVPNIPFGSVDVERDIPSFSIDMPNRRAFIISNEEYSPGQEKSFAMRDGRLINDYLDLALGVPDDQIFLFNNVSGSQTFRNALNRLTLSVNNDSTDLFVYLSGKAQLTGEGEVLLLGTGDSESTGRGINLNDFFDGLSRFPLKSISVVCDLSFTNPRSSNYLGQLASMLTDQIEQSVIVFSSQTDQDSYLYSQSNGVQRRHSIFSYFLADGIKRGNTNWTALINHMERNISFTSRSLFNRPQDIRYFGDLNRSILP